jgi:sarcosine oxidase, subunit beta
VATESADAIVVGGGIAGAAVAFHLVRGGLGKVVALEASTPAAGATGRAAGIVSEQLWCRWDVDVVRESKAEYADLAGRRAPGAYRVNGFARWTSDPEVAEALRARVAELKGWGVDVRELSPSELEGLLPAVRAQSLVAIAYAPGDAVVAPTSLAEAYFAEGRRLGVDWRLASPVTSVARIGNAWSATVRGRTVSAPVAVIAAGAWSKRVLAASGFPLPLAPYRTQAVVLRPQEAVGDLVPSFDDLDTDVYARPEEHGRILAGDGTGKVEVDPEGYVPTGDEAFVERVAESFVDRLPGWSEASVVRAWAGVCVSTPDRRPLVGAVPGAPGLYTITGFNGFGVMRAAGAAQRLAALVVDGSDRARERLAEVDPGRFAGQIPAFGPRDGFTLQAGENPRF